MNRAWQLQPGRAAWLEALFPGPLGGHGSAHAFLGNQSSPGHALQWLSTLFLGTSRDGHSPLPPGTAPGLCGAHFLGGAGTLHGVCTLTLVVPSTHLLARAISFPQGELPWRLLWLSRTPPAWSPLELPQFAHHPQRIGLGLYVLGPSCHTPVLLFHPGAQGPGSRGSAGPPFSFVPVTLSFLRPRGRRALVAAQLPPP